MEKDGMEINNIGSALQYFRETYRISQGRLCKGLCSIATLSRIEAGERDVDSLLLEALLERLGKTPNQFELILTDSDYILYQKREEITEQIKAGNYEKAEELLNAYKEETLLKGNVHKQFIAAAGARLNELRGGGDGLTMDMLTEAIEYTVPDFKTNMIKDYYLSHTELNIIMEIVRHMIDAGMYSRAEEIVLQVMDYLDKRDLTEKSSNMYTEAAVTACKLFIKKNNPAKALEICKKGLSKISGPIKLDILGELSFIKARMTEMLQKKAGKRESRKKECIKLYLQAYYIFAFCGDTDEAGSIQKHLMEEYEWENTGSGILSV